MKRQQFSREFKLEAVRLLEEGDKPVSELARELGVPRNRLYKWKAEVDAHGQEAFPGHGRRPQSIAELEQLKRENARLKEENEILKKAAKYFARESR